jgi:two-component system, OmpR family, response regulator VicR
MSHGSVARWTTLEGKCMTKGPAKILFVDDETAFREITVDLLRETGYDVVDARDGDEALDHLRSEPFDLVLLDIVMPKVDGWTVLQHIRSMLSPPRVVVMTGLHEIAPPARIGPLVSGYLVKPFTGHQLFRMFDVVFAAQPAVPQRTFTVETTVLSEAGSPVSEGKLMQVTLQGFELHTALDLKPGQSILVTLQLPGRPEPLRIRAQVQWQSDGIFGAEIKGLQPEQEKLLRELIEV